MPLTEDHEMLTCLLACEPMLQQTEDALERWCAHLSGQNAFSIDGFREGMREQATKAKAVLSGYGNESLVRRLEQQGALQTD